MTYHAMLIMCVFSLAVNPLAKLFHVNFKWGDAVSHYYIACCCAILFYFSAFRFGIGTDYFNYVDLFNVYSNSEKYNIALEPAFWFLFKFTGYFSNKSEWFFVITSGMFLFFSYLSFDKKYKPFHFVLFFLIFYLPSLSLVRQFLAISIFFVALKYVREGKFKIGFLISLLTPLFHYSSLLYIPLLLVSRLSINRFFFTGGIIFLCIGSYQFDVFSLSQNITLLSEDNYLTSYAGSEFSEKPEVGIGVVIRMLITFLVMMFVGRIRKNNYKFPTSYINFIYYSSGFYIFSLVMSSHVKIFVRLADALVFSPMLASVLVVHCIKSKINRMVFIGGVLTLYVLLFLSTVMQAQSSMGSGLGISPYNMLPIY